MSSLLGSELILHTLVVTLATKLLGFLKGNGIHFGISIFSETISEAPIFTTESDSKVGTAKFRNCFGQCCEKKKNIATKP